MSDPRSRMGSKSPGNTSQPPAFFSKLTESNSAMVKSKKQEINKKLNTHNRNEPEYSKGPTLLGGGATRAHPPWGRGHQGWGLAQPGGPAGPVTSRSGSPRCPSFSRRHLLGCHSMMPGTRGALGGYWHARVCS